MPSVASFAEWRVVARRLLKAGRPPETVCFHDSTAPPALFGDDTSETADDDPAPAVARVPPAFLELAETVGFHRDEARWNRLYRVLWRLTHGEAGLLDVASDDDVHRLLTMEKAVRRDAHKMKAFVRFRRVETEVGEHFIAWHRPDHRIVQRTAPYFARRFPTMNWTILTPDASASWDQAALSYGPGVPASAAPLPDVLEELWKAYYRATFNPARIKLAMMRREMPVRHWPTLPETALIPELLAEAPARVELMIARQEGSRKSAANYIPANADWEQLRAASKSCRGCELCEHATQTVFGEGPVRARIVLVGEQPGDQEDQVGRPFVGPAGAVLDQALIAAGLERGTVYLTNAVKHFKYEPRGKFRLHKKPRVREITACRPWLIAELEVIQPEVVVCLGATATQAIIGRDFRLTERRGEIVATDLCATTLATFHPSTVLRALDTESRERMRNALVADLRTAREAAR